MATRFVSRFAALVAFIVFASVAHAEDQFNVRFSWKLKGEYGPLYAAQEKGFYQKEGLAVRMGEGAGAQAALGALIQGQEDAVVLPGIFALTAVQKGMPVKLVAIYHPRTPLALISMPDKPVSTPRDLEGKTVAHAVGDTATEYLSVLCKLNGVDCGKVKKIQMNAQARYPQFIARQVDVTSTYTNVDLPLLEKQNKMKFVVMDLAKYGLAVPGLAVVSSDANIAKKTEVLKRYLRATGAGVRDAKRDLDGATRAMIKNWPGGPDADIVAAQVKATMAAVPEPAGKPVGWIDDKLIADTLQMLKSVGEIDNPKPLNAYFTNSLLGG